MASTLRGAGRFVSQVLVIAFLAANVRAVCDVPQPRLVCAEYFNSNAVVTARLETIKHVQPAYKQDYFLYHLTTTQVLRGDVPETFTIWEENSSARATFRWKHGTSYLLFLDPVKGFKYYDIDGCGNSGPVSSASKTLKEIASSPNQKDTLIEANVGGESDSWQGGPVTIVAERRDGKRITTRTDRNGHARFRIPPGNYRVFPLPKKNFERALFSYDDPQHITAVDGSCSQVVFEGITGSPQK